MQDKFWTTELVNEYAGIFLLQAMKAIEAARNGGAVEKIISASEFIASKSPKKEWEIVAFGEHFDGRILLYKLQQDTGFYRNVDDDCPIEYAAHQFTNANEFIHSVRRLSDGEVFSVGDGLAHHSDPITKIEIDSAWGGGIVLRCGSKTDADALSIAEKLPQAILTTVDGVEIFEGEMFWSVSLFKIFEFTAGSTVAWPGPNMKSFSTREAAEEYILNNRPLLSLNDVKEYLGVTIDKSLLEELTALVKQKLNQ